MSKIITEVDNQITHANAKFETARAGLAKFMEPFNDLHRAASDAVGWSSFAVTELKGRLSTLIVANQLLAEENRELRGKLERYEDER